MKYSFRILKIAFSVFALTGSVGLVRVELRVINWWPQGDGVCADSPLRITFNEPPFLGDHGRIEVLRESDHKEVVSLDLRAKAFVDRYGPETKDLLRFTPVRIDKDTATVRLYSHRLAPRESYIVRIEPGVFKDGAGHLFGGLTTDEHWGFKTRAESPRELDRITVGADGSGDFCTIQGAIDQVQAHRVKPVKIFIRKGVYPEMVRIPHDKPKIHLIGEDRKETVLACTNNENIHSGLMRRSVLGVKGDDFVLENLTVRNTTPQNGGAAEAVFISADRCILRNADFYSLQDSLDLNGRIYVSNCYVEGDVDFIWGYGSGCFENCILHAVHDGIYLQARNEPGVIGYVYINCNLTAAAGVKKVPLARADISQFPGSHVTFIHCKMGGHVPAKGWIVTGDGSAEQLRFEEFESTDLEGKPLDVSRRHRHSKQLTAEEAIQRSNVAKLLADGDGWNPKAELD